MCHLRKWLTDFKNHKKNQNDNYYDLIDDYDLIEQSFFKQYGIRLRSAELETDEFLNLLSGIMADTPLGLIVQIRSETDPDVINSFTPEQKRIRSEWINKKAKEISKEDYDKAMENFKNMLISLTK